MRRSRPSRSGRNFSAAAALLLHLGAFVVGEQRALSTPAGAGGAAGATGYKGKTAYGFYDVGEDCTPSSLWFKEVDAESYELGCREIEVSSKRRLQLLRSILWFRQVLRGFARRHLRGEGLCALVGVSSVLHRLTTISP